MSYLNSLPISEALFELEPSWMSIRLLAVCSLWALFAVFLSNFYMPIKVILSVFIIIAMFHSLWLHYRSIQNRIYFQNGRWLLETSLLLERFVAVEVLVDVGLFILIRFKRKVGHHHLLVFQDQWPEDKLRRFMALHHMIQKQSLV